MAREQEARKRMLTSGLCKMAFGVVWLLLSQRLIAQELNLSSSRPTIANSATIQNPGVLQVEIGVDSYPQRVAGNQQTIATNFYYVPLKSLRLDFGWSPFSYQDIDGQKVSGIGTTQVGGKVVLSRENYGRPEPGLAVQYEAELPTASKQALQGFGQQIIFIANHHYGSKGIIDVIVNGSLVQSGCQTQSGCTYGGQQAIAVSYHLRDNTRLYAEVSGQNNSQSNTPPGTYVFGGFYQKVRDAFGINGGMRFGVANHSASVGLSVGMVFGVRLRNQASPRPGLPIGSLR